MDSLGRPLTDLRISVTDRCNFRCPYCMPKSEFGPGYRFLKRDKLLTLEEIHRIAQLFVNLGVTKIRLTGGEPLIRPDVEVLVGMLSSLPHLQSVCMTTNGALLTPARALALRRAGLERITVSLDALDDATFRRMNGRRFPVARVLEAIKHAAEAGLSPIKVNMVVKRGINDHAVVPMARYFRGSGHIVRFIEYMDVGATNGWRHDEVVGYAEILSMLRSEFSLSPAAPHTRSEVATRWRYCDGSGEIGIIASVTRPFCRTCSRARLSANGLLYTCLFAPRGHDLRTLLRNGAPDEQISRAIQFVWTRRGDRYSEIRSANTSNLLKPEMSYIGG